MGAIDTDLDPEINVNYELGARLRYGALNVEAIGFYSHYSDTGCSGNRRYLYHNEKNS
ncbi:MULTISPECIES: TonB-dependent receptor [Marinobacter]|uniref:TonB-dependent receptor n=1 Tax=Marinobacter TaxID=2742 RepID=UPI000B2E48DA|nr:MULTISPECIES: TonB-dependent receptor [Marinobacter]MCD1628793.1 TonB-dependent receptor [Marinobacter shengliensis]MCK7553447.1 TonB-dependent receptor [Marinobacter goseongensis]